LGSASTTLTDGGKKGSSHNDGCVDDHHCPGCVQFESSGSSAAASSSLLTGANTSSQLHFTPDNWQELQNVSVIYSHDGDSQLKVTSQDYYLHNVKDL
jgi:hypothetical protein